MLLVPAVVVIAAVDKAVLAVEQLAEQVVEARLAGAGPHPLVVRPVVEMLRRALIYLVVMVTLQVVYLLLVVIWMVATETEIILYIQLAEVALVGMEEAAVAELLATVVVEVVVQAIQIYLTRSRQIHLDLAKPAQDKAIVIMSLAQVMAVQRARQPSMEQS